MVIAKLKFLRDLFLVLVSLLPIRVWNSLTLRWFIFNLLISWLSGLLLIKTSILFDLNIVYDFIDIYLVKLLTKCVISLNLMDTVFLFDWINRGVGIFVLKLLLLVPVDWSKFWSFLVMSEIISSNSWSSLKNLFQTKTNKFTSSQLPVL